MEHFKKYLQVTAVFMCGFYYTAWSQDTFVPSKNKGLDFFIEKAFVSSPAIKDYNNQLLINKIDSMRLSAGYGPQVAASSTGMYAPVIKGYGYDKVITNSQVLDALININYALTGSGWKKNQYKGLFLQRDSILYASKLTELDLRKAITEQYIAAFDSQQQVSFGRDICVLLNNEELILKKLTQANAYKQTDYLTFLVTLKQQELQLQQAEQQLKNDLSVLNYLSGINDTAKVILREPVLKNDVAPLPVNAESFFVKPFDLDSLKAVNEREAIGFSYRPKLVLYVNGGYNSSLALQPYKNFGTSAGFTVSMPIYDGHQKKMQFNRFGLQMNTGMAYRDFFVKRQHQQVEMLRQQIDATEGMYKKIDEQIRFTRGLIEADSKLLRTGDVKIADFVIAINNYMAAQNLFRQTSISRLKLISQLNYWNR